MSAGELGTLGGSFGIWMHLAQGEVSEDKTKPLSKMLPDARLTMGYARAQ